MSDTAAFGSSNDPSVVAGQSVAEGPDASLLTDVVVVSRAEWQDRWVASESWWKWWSDPAHFQAAVDREVAARISQSSSDICNALYPKTNRSALPATPPTEAARIAAVLIETSRRYGEFGTDQTTGQPNVSALRSGRAA